MAGDGTVLTGGLGRGLDVSQALVGPSSVVQMSRWGREERGELEEERVRGVFKASRVPAFLHLSG